MALSSGRCWQFEDKIKFTYDGKEYYGNQYRDLVNNRTFDVFYFPGDDDAEAGCYLFEWGFINSAISYKSDTEAEL